MYFCNKCVYDWCLSYEWNGLDSIFALIALLSRKLPHSISQIYAVNLWTCWRNVLGYIKWGSFSLCPNTALAKALAVSLVLFLDVCTISCKLVSKVEFSNSGKRALYLSPVNTEFPTSRVIHMHIIMLKLQMVIYYVPIPNISSSPSSTNWYSSSSL